MCSYSDGTIRVWNFRASTQKFELRGHRKRVTCLQYSADGALLASGSADTDVTVWDTTAQAGLFRLRGHRDGITAVQFVSLPSPGSSSEDAEGGQSRKRPLSSALLSGAAEGGQLVASASKDGFVKLWDMDTQHCVQTIVSHRAEVWALLASPHGGGRILTGSSDVHLRMWEVCDAQRAQDVALAQQQAAAREAAAAALEAEAEGGEQSSAPAPAAAGGGSAVGELVPEYLHSIGGVHRKQADRTMGIATSAVVTSDDGSDTAWLVVHGNNRAVEVWRWRGAAEAARKAARRHRRAREKAAKGGAAEGEDAAAAGAGAEDAAWRESSSGTLGQDELEYFGHFKASAKVKAVMVLPPSAIRGGARATAQSASGGAVSDAALLRNTVHVTVSTHGNTLETHELQRVAEAPDSDAEDDSVSSSVQHKKVAVVSQAGHRSDVRAVAMSRDGALALTADSKGGKLWNLRSGACLRSFDSGYGISAVFLPGEQYGVFGCKDGSVSVWALATGDQVALYAGGEEGEGHDGATWSLALRPDGQAMASGSADKTVRFWEIEREEGGCELVHSRTLKMADEVLCVRFSHHRDSEKLLLAVALLDSTVKLFFNDTLKFSLSLYGHKLPVMGLDISADNTLLVSASADKTIKLWGLDFGDCHKSFRAHDDSVMGVAFLGTSHHFVSGGKDSQLKYWDGDRFEYVTNMPGHKGPVWSVAASRDGVTVLSGSADRSVRVWRRSEDLVFPEEEREREMLADMDAEARAPEATVLDSALASVPTAGGEGEGDPTAAGAGALQESGAVMQSNGGGAAGRASDRLMEALELADKLCAEWREYSADLESAVRALSASQRAHRERRIAEGKSVPVLSPAPTPSALLLGKTPAEFVLHTLRSVKSTDLESALLLLPYSYAVSMLRYALHLLRRGVEAEAVTKAAQFLIKVHATQLAAGPAQLAALLSSLQSVMTGRMAQLVDLAGVSAAGASMLQRRFAAQGRAWGGPPKEDAKEDKGPVIKSFKRRVVLL